MTVAPFCPLNGWMPPSPRDCGPPTSVGLGPEVVPAPTSCLWKAWWEPDVSKSMQKEYFSGF